MNLFCFSLEGSMDSLYEAVQSSADAPPQPVPSRASSRPCSRTVSRSGSPAVLLGDHRKSGGSGRSISRDAPQMSATATNKKKKRAHVAKSASDNETLDGPCANNGAVWHPTRSQEDLVHVPSHHNEELRRIRHQPENKGGKGTHHSSTKKKEKPASSLGNGNECKNTVKRGHKAGKKAVSKSGKDTLKKNHHSRGQSPSAVVTALPGSRLDVPCRADRQPYLGKCSTLPVQENSTPGRGFEKVNLPGGATPTHSQRWSNPADCSPLWGSVPHTCRRPHTEYRVCSQDFSCSGGRDMDQIKQRLGPTQDSSLKRDSRAQGTPKVPRSVTDLDLSEPNRSTSFGRFDRHNSPSKTEAVVPNEATEECESPDPNKSAGLGKKIKVISLTMRKRMGKKHKKSLSEEAADDTDREAEAEAQGPKNSARSLESLYSGLSCSSGVSEGLGSAQRDSVKLEEDGSYLGQFCGRARVHTDFVPSPYDTDSLKLKTGDIINIISKPPMGIWTGMLNSKVGNFKFIYVDVLVEKEEENEEEETPKIRQQKLCKRPRPKTLLELLERLNLEEYASALLLNGYQTVEDLRHLQEKHLIELNVKDPEHRLRLLAAADLHYTEDDPAEEHISSLSPQEEDSDCARDSGCFIPSECSDTKEDSETLAEGVST